MARKKFSCDFETTTDPNDCRVWGYGVMEIGNISNYHIDNSIVKFMTWAEKSNADLYFHNLRFDGSFIVGWLLHQGYEWSEDARQPGTFSTLISKMGQWYAIEICFGYRGKRKLSTKIYDSLKKLPFSVDRIGKAFDLATLKIDVDSAWYERPREKGHIITDEEFEYIKHDVQVVAEALQIQFDQGLDSITIGTDSLKTFKDMVGAKEYNKLFPTFSRELDGEFRLAYRGGFTWLNEKHKGIDLNEGIVFDVNSLYPSVMYKDLLPWGDPINYNGQYEHDEHYPLYIQHIRCEFLIKENKIPMIQVKNRGQRMFFKQNEYLDSSRGQTVDLYMTNIDMKMFLEHYSVYDLEYCEGWKFKGVRGVFNRYIEKWTAVKESSTGAMRELAKLMLNNLYGKFATNPDVTGKVPYLRPDKSLAFTEGDEDFKEPVYTPMGVFITSYAREVCIGTAQKVYPRIIYCDTDSIHLTGSDIPRELDGLVHPTKIGMWDHEGTFKRARYVKQKTYCYNMYAKEIEVDGEQKVIPVTDKNEATTTLFSVTGAGMSDNVKKHATWENFKIGFTSWGNLKGKQVPGGVVLNDSEFTLMEG